jgi:hypothetical protein
MRALRDLMPDLPTVISSGCAPVSVELCEFGLSDGAPGVVVLVKPFDPHRLADVIEAIEPARASSAAPGAGPRYCPTVDQPAPALVDDA